jgi:hypothetical protein
MSIHIKTTLSVTIDVFVFVFIIYKQGHNMKFLLSTYTKFCMGYEVVISDHTYAMSKSLVDINNVRVVVIS